MYISGKLIHNTPAMEELHSRGVQELDVSRTTEASPGSPFILRAHGEGPEVYPGPRSWDCGLSTAPAGSSGTSRERARALEDQGFQVVLFGHRHHPEAKATIAHTQRGIIIQSAAEAAGLPNYPKIAAIAQTT